MSVETEAAEIPALEIERELTLHVANDLRKQKTAPGRHGPCVSRDNPIVSMVHNQHQQRIYIGMQLGEVMFWDLKRPKSKGTDVLYSQHSSHKLVGRHAVSLGIHDTVGFKNVLCNCCSVCSITYREPSTAFAAYAQQHTS